MVRTSLSLNLPVALVVTGLIGGCGSGSGSLNSADEELEEYAIAFGKLVNPPRLMKQHLQTGT